MVHSNLKQALGNALCGTESHGCLLESSQKRDHVVMKTLLSEQLLQKPLTGRLETAVDLHYLSS